MFIEMILCCDALITMAPSLKNDVDCQEDFSTDLALALALLTSSGNRDQPVPGHGNSTPSSQKQDSECMSHQSASPLLIFEAILNLLYFPFGRGVFFH